MLYKKHKWDVVVLYYHPHGKGDTIAYYGTPGVAAKFLGLCPGQEKMSPAGQGALDLFKKFIDRRYHSISIEITPSSCSYPAYPAGETPI